MVKNNKKKKSRATEAQEAIGDRGARRELPMSDGRGSSIIDGKPQAIIGNLNTSIIHYYQDSQGYIVSLQGQACSYEQESRDSSSSSLQLSASESIRDRANQVFDLSKKIKKEKKERRKPLQTPRRLRKESSQIINQEISTYNPDKNVKKACSNLFRYFLSQDKQTTGRLDKVRYLSTHLIICFVIYRSKLTKQEFNEFLAEYRTWVNDQLKRYNGYLLIRNDKTTRCYINAFENSLISLKLFEQGKQFEAIQKFYNKKKQGKYFMSHLRVYLKWKQTQQRILTIPQDDDLDNMATNELKSLIMKHSKNTDQYYENWADFLSL